MDANTNFSSAEANAQIYIEGHSHYFASTAIDGLRNMIARLPSDKLSALNAISLKNPQTVIILSVLLGWLGIDRFYLGDIWMGIIKLITGGFFGIWWIVDWFLVGKEARAKNFAAVNTYVRQNVL